MSGGKEGIFFIKGFRPFSSDSHIISLPLPTGKMDVWCNYYFITAVLHLLMATYHRKVGMSDVRNDLKLLFEPLLYFNGHESHQSPIEKLIGESLTAYKDTQHAFFSFFLFVCFFQNMHLFAWSVGTARTQIILAVKTESTELIPKS